MRLRSDCRRATPAAAKALLVGLLSCGVVACSNNLSDTQVLSKLRESGLTVERLDENLLTVKQRQRIESEPETLFAVTISDDTGRSQKMTLVGFDHDWKADHVGDEGVPGFAVRNWYFAGVVTVPGLRARIEDALQ